MPAQITKTKTKTKINFEYENVLHEVIFSFQTNGNATVTTDFTTFITVRIKNYYRFGAKAPKQRYSIKNYIYLKY